MDQESAQTLQEQVHTSELPQAASKSNKLVTPYPANKSAAAASQASPARPMQFLRPAERQKGRIELIMGCMFAGKTTEMLRRCNKHNITGKKVLRVKFSADKRYGADFKISTHSGIQKEAKPISELAQLGTEWLEYDVIGIDEGQFFADIVEFSEKAANSGKVVIISSLQGTFLRGAFPNILSLIPKCEKIKKLTAICKLCKQSASFTFRTASKDCQTMIGGENMYMPLCRDCHRRESQANAENAYQGDPSKISVEIENKQFEKTSQGSEEGTPGQVDSRRAKLEEQSVQTPASVFTATTGSGGSPNAKSFTSSEDSMERDQSISLRKINSHHVPQKSNDQKHRSEERRQPLEQAATHSDVAL